MKLMISESFTITIKSMKKPSFSSKKVKPEHPFSQPSQTPGMAFKGMLNNLTAFFC